MTGRHRVSLFFGLALLGTAMPLSQFLPWVAANGLDVPRFIGDLFANGISGFFAWDVIVSAVVTIVFIAVQGERDGIGGRWIPIAATLLIGVSCGLPLFLAMRERRLSHPLPSVEFSG